MTELPIYCLLGARPAKVFRTADGGVDLVAYDWDSGTLVRDLTLLERVLQGAAEVERVDEARFETALSDLRAARAAKPRD